MNVTPFPKASMRQPPPAEEARPAPLVQPPHTHVDVPQSIRLNVSSLHKLAARLHSSLGQHAATHTVMADAEEQLVELAERALALRHALVQERQRRAAGGAQ